MQIASKHVVSPTYTCRSARHDDVFPYFPQGTKRINVIHKISRNNSLQNALLFVRKYSGDSYNLYFLVVNRLKLGLIGYMPLHYFKFFDLSQLFGDCTRDMSFLYVFDAIGSTRMPSYFIWSKMSLLPLFPPLPHLLTYGPHVITLLAFFSNRPVHPSSKWRLSTPYPLAFA